MYIHRTRPPYSEEELAVIYWEKYDHTRWEDHIHRVQKTIEFARGQITEVPFGIDLIIDLSCGDARIPRDLAASSEDPPEIILGDYVEGYDFYGSIEQTIHRLPSSMGMGNRLFVMTETLEHLNNPMYVLDAAAHQTDYLLLSTPIHNPGEVDENEQHYWTWDREGVEVFTRAAGFEPIAYDEIYNGQGYRYGLWWFE